MTGYSRFCEVFTYPLLTRLADTQLKCGDGLSTNQAAPEFWPVPKLKPVSSSAYSRPLA